MTFLDAVNRVFRSDGVIRGDTDAITSFSNLQHGATTQLAMIAIQDELNELTADELLPYEHDSTGSISTVAGTRSYSLASDFIQFFGIASLFDSTTKNRLFEYQGGEARLQHDYPDYKTAQSEPINWYFDLTTTKKIAFWPVPNAVKTYTYDYEQDVSVTAAGDTLPFHNEQEAQAFCRLATRRFKLLRGKVDAETILVDPERQAAKSTLLRLMRGVNPAGNYAPVYR